MVSMDCFDGEFRSEPKTPALVALAHSDSPNQFPDMYGGGGNEIQDAKSHKPSNINSDIIYSIPKAYTRIYTVQ